MRDNTITGGRIGILIHSYWEAPMNISGNTVRYAAAAGMLIVGDDGSSPGTPTLVTEAADNLLELNAISRPA